MMGETMFNRRAYPKAMKEERPCEISEVLHITILRT
jgi:hypothetical protein